MADLKSVEQRIKSLEGRLDQQIAKAKSAQTTTIIIGIVLVLFMVIYFSWASTQLQNVLQPTDVASVASDQIVTSIQEYRPEVEKMAREEAPQMVNRLVDEVVLRQLPEGRQFIEEFIEEEGDRNIQAMTEFILDQFNMVMDNHEDEVREMVEALQTEEGKQQFEEEMYNRIQEAMSDDEIMINILAYGDALDEIERNLKLIAETPPEEMDDLQKATYDLLVVVRELGGRSKLTLDDFPTLPGVDEMIEGHMADPQ